MTAALTLAVTARGIQTFRCLQPVTHKFQFKIHLAKVQLSCACELILLLSCVL